MSSNFKDASVGVKLVALSVVGILLGMGLCGVGFSYGDNGGVVGNLVGTAGVVLFWLSVLGFFIGTIMALINRR